jgi:hypothetical protein
MTHLQKVAARMVKEHLTLQELGITLTDIREMRDKGYHIHAQQQPGRGRVYYIGNPEEAPYVYHSGKNNKEHKWVELSDTHAGCKQFDSKGLRECLQRAVDDGYEDVHISGDLHDGYRVYKGQEHNLKYFTSDDQAQCLAEVLIDYPLNYYAIMGNHDESFEKHGSPNPVARLEEIMHRAGGAFVYLNCMAGDIIIGGVVKRMVHLDGGGAYAKSYPGQVYLRNLFDSRGEDVWVRGNKYRLRFGQFGHFHSNITYESNGMWCTHPGNFQFPSSFTIRRGLVGDQGCRLTTVKMENGVVYDYTSKFIKPKKPYRQ